MSQEKSLDPVEQNRKYFRRGALTGGAAVGIIALLYSSCEGDTKPQQNHTIIHIYNISDAGMTDASTAITAACPEGQSCYADNKICQEEQGCYDVTLVDYLKKNLEDCFAENETLSKRQKSCPTYTPKPCPTIKEIPPMKECPRLPYIRKGD